MDDKSAVDYYDQLYVMFPDIPKEDIRRAVNYGWRQYLILASANADIMIRDNELWSYLGKIQIDTIKHFNSYTNKLAIKIRMLYKRYKVEWNGFYYFALNDSQYENYLNQTKKRRGRPKRFIEYGTTKLYKIKEECEVRERMKKHIFKVPKVSDDIGFIYFVKDLTLDNAEQIIERKPLVFQDLMNINKNYTYAKATSK